MQLSSFKYSGNNTFKKSKVKDVFKCKLFYVYYGRNAWHSTWVTKYAEGSIHTSFESARIFVESKRVQGSVFYISELPGVVYQTEKGCVIITEINTKKVLKGFNHFEKLEELSYGEPTVAINAVLNSKLNDVSKSFDPCSEHWIERTRYFNSVQILSTTKKGVEFENFNKRKNLRHRSYSIGAGYRYFYSETKEAIEDEFIDTIIKESKRFDLRNSNKYNTFQFLSQNKVLTPNSENISKEVEIFYNDLRSIKSPVRGNVWLKDENNILNKNDLNEINKFLVKYAFKAVLSETNLDFFISKPIINLSILYPLNFLKKILEDPYFAAPKLLEHLKLILIRAKIRNKSKGRIAIGIYDKFLKNRIFIFPLNIEKEELIVCLEELPNILSESFEEFGLSPKELYQNQIYQIKDYEWELKSYKPFVNLVYPNLIKSKQLL
jgi:hypothetical protein